MTTFVRHALAVASTVVGPLALALQRRRGAGVVFLYHRVGPQRDPVYEPLAPSVLAAHFELIRRHYRVIPLSEIIERVRQQRSLRGYCAITFDDGFRDFLEHAYPILQRFALPVTHFLVADCVERGEPPWTYRALRQRCDAAGLAFLASLRAEARYAWLAEREATQRALAPLPPMIGVDDLGAVDPTLVEWGSHTVAHSYLTRLSLDDAFAEMNDSKRRLEALSGQRIRYLAYPDGYNDENVAALAQAAGYDAAMAVRQAEISMKSPLFSLPRFDVGGHPTAMLPLEATGAIEALRRLRRR